jgi:hypothetical protein
MNDRDNKLMYASRCVTKSPLFSYKRLFNNNVGTVLIAKRTPISKTADLFFMKLL